MIETYTLIKQSKSYKTLANNIIDYGMQSRMTQFLKHESIELDVSHLDDRMVCLPRYRATGKVSSIKYAIAETIWYASRQRQTSLIAKFGPIWKQMEDSNGLVNSNYGYQIFNNQDFEEKSAELIRKKKVRFLIASDENQHSRTDLVCNNAVDIYLDDENQLSVRVVARSIDLIFGYPYDMFAAQLFVRYLQRYLMNKLNISTSFKNLRFDIENVHIYKRNISSIQEIKDFNDTEFIVIDSEEIFSAIEKLDFETLDVSDVVAIRETLAQKAKIVDLRAMNERSNEIRRFIYRDTKPLLLQHRLFGKDVEYSRSIDRFNQVIEYLREDKFDRKNLIKYEDSLLYVTRIKHELFADEYEVMKYDL